MRCSPLQKDAGSVWMPKVFRTDKVLDACAKVLRAEVHRLSSSAPEVEGAGREQWWSALADINTAAQEVFSAELRKSDHPSTYISVTTAGGATSTFSYMSVPAVPAELRGPGNYLQGLLHPPPDPRRASNVGSLDEDERAALWKVLITHLALSPILTMTAAEQSLFYMGVSFFAPDLGLRDGG